MPAYLDHAATTPMRPEAVEAMLPFMTEHFGNPSGMHAQARYARAAIDDAREVVAEALGADASEVVFTSGGTESDNLALMGAYAMGAGSIACSAIEHHAVLRCVEALGGHLVRATSDGLVDLDHLAATLNPSVSVVSVMMVNNEIGTIQPLHKVRRVMEKLAPKAVLHTDAVQATPWIDVNRYARSADLVSISSHKFGGPQGVGALVVRKGVKLAPLVHGGGQERERRSGTQNVAGIVGMAAALKATLAERDEVVGRVAPLRNRLVDSLMREIPGTYETGNRSDKIAGNAHLRFDDVESEALLILLDEGGVYASAGASCSSGALEPSHVLTAMGFSSKEAMNGVRLSLGHTTNEYDIEIALKVIPDAIAKLRGH
jgi:cysteine desulfurase